MSKNTFTKATSLTALAAAVAGGTGAVSANETTTPVVPIDSPDVTSETSEQHVTPTTSIPQVEGAEVSNGTALVTKTPTEAVVEEAKKIKEQADQAVEAQTPVVEEAKKQETATAGAEDSAKQALEQAEQKKKAATPEAIEGTKSAIGASKKEVTTHTEKIDSLKEQQNQVQGKKNAQEAVVKDATEATNNQAKKVAGAEKKVQNAQDVLNGTGADKVIKEEKDAKKDLKAKKAIVKDAKQALEQAQATDATKAGKLNDAKGLEAEQKNTFEQATSVLSNATQAHNEASSKLGVAQQNKDNAQAVLDGTGTKAILNERDNAESDLATKKSEFEDAATNLNDAKRADAKKAEQVAGATTSLKEATATLNQAESNLSDAQAAANQASDELKNKKKAEKKAKETLDASKGKVADVTNERNDAKSDLATKEDTLANATTNLEDAKGKDAEKVEQLHLLDEAKIQAEEEEATTKKAETKAQGGANLASTKLQKATDDEKEAKDSLTSSESRLEGVTTERDNAKSDLATKQAKKEDAERKLEDAKKEDAQKHSDIQDLKTLKGQQEDTVRETTQELTDATSVAENAENAKNEADKAVDTLEKQISAIKNLTIPQLPQNVISAYKTYLTDESEANKHALNNAIQAWFKGSKYDFGERQFEWSQELQQTVFKGWANKNIVLPIDDTVVNLDNPTDEQIKALSHYYTLLVNNLQDQIWGAHNLIVTKESIQGIRAITKNYADENKPYNSGHSNTALENDGVDSVKWNGEILNYTNTLSNTSSLEKAINTEKTRKATMSQLYREVYDAVLAFMVRDIHADFGHMKGMVGRVAPTYPSAVGGNISYTKNNVGRMHFVQFAGQNAHTETTLNPTTGERTSVHIDDYYDKGIAKPLPTPFDTSKMEEDLVQAKETQVSALTTHNNAQRRLSAAKRADETAKSELATTTTRLNTLLNTQDLTPNAERVLDTAKSELSQAELRNTNANTAYVNLIQEIEDKRATHKVTEKALSKATVANKVAQEALEEATTAHNNDLNKLNSIKDTIKRTKAIKDLTPEAQTTFDTAKAEHQTAKTRLATAEKALTDLNNEINTNSDALNTAKSELRQAEQTDKDAQATLKEATSVKNTASEALDAAKDALYKANAIKDLTPEAQATFDQAELAYNTAKTRLENAKTAVNNLNADLKVKRQALEDAVKALKEAETLAKTTKAELEVAQATYQKSNDKLTATRKVIAILEATKDLTPDAQKAYDEALEAETLAEKRLSDAKVAVENLTADVKTKQEALNNAQAELAQEEKALEELKEKQAQEEKVLATIQAQLDDLKTQEKTVRAEIAKIEDSIKEMEVLLDSLIHAPENHEVAKEEYEKALEAHRLALQTLEAEQAKLNVLLQNQLDAKAQYEAVLEAYNKHQDDVNKAEEILSYKRLNNRIGQELVQSFDVAYTGNFVTTKENATDTYAGNKRLPQTNEAQSVLSLVGFLIGGTILLSTKKKED